MLKQYRTFFIIVAVMFGVITFGTAVVLKTNVNMLLMLGGAISGVLVLLLWPNLGTYMGLFIIHTNLSVIAYQFHGVPQIAAGATWLVIGVPFLVYIFIFKQKVMLDYTLFIMLFLLASVLMSYFGAINKAMALDWIFTYFIEGIVLYFIILNVVLDRHVLRQCVWAFMISGALLGSLTLYQDVTKHYENDFGGLAQRQLAFGVDDEGPAQRGGGVVREREKVRRAHRADGPIGDPNRFSQIQLMIFPLILFRFWDEKKMHLKLLAVAGTVLALSGMFLTYSRGAFVTLCIIIGLMTLMRYIRPGQLIASVLLMLVVVAIASPGYFNRIATIGGVEALFKEEAEAESDTVILKRTTEMLAAMTVFLDYPVFGVGPNQYTKYYSEEYMANPDIAFHNMKTTRAAHSLYFQMLAEIGLLGFLGFMSIIGYTLFQLNRSRKWWKGRDQELTNFATGCMLAIIAYLSTSIFLSFAYQRYCWMIIAIGGATVQLLNMHREEVENEELQKARRGENPGMPVEPEMVGQR